MNNDLKHEVVSLINLDNEDVQSFRVHKFKNKWLIDVLLKNVDLLLTIDDNIKVQSNSNTARHLLNFMGVEKTFTLEQFKTFFNALINDKVSKETKNLVAEYHGKQYVCDIEAISIDPDRPMGNEVFYEVNFVDVDGNAVIAAEVSEYPSGNFAIYNINKEVNISRQAIIKQMQNMFGNDIA